MKKTDHVKKGTVTPIRRRGVLPKLTKKVGPYVFADPDMRGVLNKFGKPWTTYTIGQYNMEQVLYRHNRFHAQRTKVVSEATKAHRWDSCKSFMRTLQALGFKLVLPTSISRKHIIALTRYWEQSDLAVSTVLQKVSNLRTLMGWMGKDRLMESITREDMFAEPKTFVREYASTTDKSWGDVANVDMETIFKSVESEDKLVGIQLRLSHYFGFRVKEAARFRPFLDFDVDGNVLIVTRGTKGAKARYVTIDTEEQIQALETAKELCISKSDSMIPRRRTQSAWIKHYYRVCNRHGISRENGITPHGLRHGYAHRVYELHAGVKPKSVTGKKPEVDSATDRIARLIVSRQLGHNRESISSAYIGDNK